MKKHGKKYRQAEELIDRNKTYSIDEAVGLLKKFPQRNFDESVEMSFDLNVDPKHADQLVRGTVVLPNGTGKSVKVVVFAQGEVANEAKEAGADFVGYKDLAEKVQGGWMDFDVAIAAPDAMKVVGKLGRVLGPKGLMPSPKAGTVTKDVAKAVKEVKAGRIEFRVDKQGNLQFVIGKKSFTKEALTENAKTAVSAVIGARPIALKGRYILNTILSTSMGPGISLDARSMVK